MSSWQQSIIYLCFISLIMVLFALSISISSDSQRKIDQIKQILSQVLSEAFANKSYVFLTLGFLCVGSMFRL